MTDFDTTLTARLERLDAAIPTARSLSAPQRVAAAPRPRRLRRLVPLLVAAVFVVGGGAVVAERVFYPDVPDRALEAALAQVFEGSGCTSPDDARTGIRTMLDESGHETWTIREHGSVAAATCVGAGLDVTTHEIFVMSALGSDAIDRFEIARNEMLERCMNRTEATAFASSVIRSAGITDFNIVSDPIFGVRGGPIDQIDEYYAHVDAGCYVWTPGVGTTESGHRTFYLWGPWP
jgi:hypothetical protein